VRACGRAGVRAGGRAGGQACVGESVCARPTLVVDPTIAH